MGQGGLVGWRLVFTGGRLPVANWAERSHIVCVDMGTCSGGYTGWWTVDIGWRMILFRWRLICFSRGFIGVSQGWMVVSINIGGGMVKVW